MAGYSKDSPFPPTMSKILKYCDNFILDSGATSGLVGAENQFRMNSLYDPDLTNVGHQPYNFDQLTPIYNRYRVNRIDIKLEFTDPSADGLFLFVKYRSSSAASSALAGSSMIYMEEQPSVWCKPINNTGSQVVVFNNSVPIAAIEGISQAQLIANDGYQAVVTASPSKVPLFDFAVGHGSANNVTCTVKMTLLFHATFFDRNTVANS
jgi:hypothetical protein